jgi:hypothetical protein
MRLAEMEKRRIFLEKKLVFTNFLKIPGALGKMRGAVRACERAGTGRERKAG